MRFLAEIISGIVYGNQLTVFFRLLAGVLFIYAGFFKILDPAGFREVILLYNIIPADWTPYAALIVPWIELLCGVMLFFGFRVRPAALVMVVLMLLFSVFIAVNIARGNTFDCGCLELSRLGLGIQETLGMHLLVRNLFIVLILLLLFAADRHLLSIEHFFEKKGLRKI